MKPIRIISPELSLVGEIDNYLSFSFCRRYYSPGEFQLVTNTKVQSTNNLNTDQLIMLGADTSKVGIIRYKEIKTNDQGEEILTVKGYSLEVITKQRITIPPIGLAQDIQEADAETVMKNYVQRNCLDIPGMEFPNLIIAPNQHRGGVIKWQSRYKNLAEELEKISRLTGLGWTIYPDFEIDKWVFDIYEAQDVSVNQTIFPPVIFSPEFDNVGSQDLTDSLIGYGNYAVVAGQGEGAAREIVMTGSGDLGLDRHVIFVDARNIESNSDLELRGRAALLDYPKIMSLSSDTLMGGPFEYEKDWDLGDIVTVQNKKWNITMDSRITEVTETYESSGFKLNVVFGDGQPTLIDVIKRELGQFGTELKR